MNREKTTPKLATAAEFINKLDQDPEFVRRREGQGKHVRALAERLARAERPLVEALNDAGVPVKSVWNLVNTAKDYPQAIPVLVAHLKDPLPFRIREGIARALTVKHAGEAAYTELVREFKELPDSTDAAQHGFKWALANAISVVAERGHFHEVVELVRDRRHGTTRGTLALRLPDLDRDQAVGALIDLLADDEVSGQALMALGKLKSQKARPRIEHLLTHHPQPWVRKEAGKALAKLRK